MMQEFELQDLGRRRNYGVRDTVPSRGSEEVSCEESTTMVTSNYSDYQDKVSDQVIGIKFLNLFV